MKAAYTRYGPPDVIEVGDLDKPVPRDNEVLVRVRAASVNPLDWKTMKGGPYIVRLLLGLRKPKINQFGVDVAGQVEAVGRNVTQFRPGDAVFGTCRGAFAEYACTWGSVRIRTTEYGKQFKMVKANILLQRSHLHRYGTKAHLRSCSFYSHSAPLTCLIVRILRGSLLQVQHPRAFLIRIPLSQECPLPVNNVQNRSEWMSRHCTISSFQL